MTDIKVFQTERDKEMYALGRKDALESLMQEVEKSPWTMHYDMISGFPNVQGNMQRTETEKVSIIKIHDLNAVVERLK